MERNKKILSFIVNEEKFLALYSKPHPKHGKGGWFVVTGSVEEGETNEEAVAREILEETALKVLDIFDLNWGSIYNWFGKDHEEHNFLSFVKLGEIEFNEEHSKYEWLNLNDFIERTRTTKRNNETKKNIRKRRRIHKHNTIQKINLHLEKKKQKGALKKLLGKTYLLDFFEISK